MSSVDDRIVQMKFDNAQFQKGVADTNKSLDTLKSSLNLDASARSLNELQSAGSKFSLANIADSVEGLAGKFTALSVVGITALVNIANKAVDAGLTIAKSLTIDPIAEGYADYGRKITSMQTIMNATGADMKTVGGYFSELDTYADKTIYNLDDMTGAFAKFTNAGVGMDKSVPAIKGIANMVALAGQDAGAASIAMYNLSQSIAGGFLTTTDYKSLNLANVATKEWKDQMIAGAVAAGKLDKIGDKYHIVGTKAGAASTAAELFNDDLKEGWATTDVLLSVLGKYGDTSTDIGKKAQSAAQDVKSWGMMMETLSASVGTGWTDTFEIILGNVDEAKALFTPLTNTIGGFLDEMSKSRNDPLQEWKDLGGRKVLIDALVTAFHALMSIIKPIKQAWGEIFPPVTGKMLLDITNKFKAFTETLKPSAATIENIHRTFKGVFAALDIGWFIVQKVFGVFGKLFQGMQAGGAGLLGITAKIGDMVVKFRDLVTHSSKVNKFFETLGQAIQNVMKFINDLLGKIPDVMGKVPEMFRQIVDKFSKVKFDTSGFTSALANLKHAFDGMKPTGDTIVKIWDGVINLFKKGLDLGKQMGDKLAQAFSGMGSGMNDMAKGIDFHTILGIIGTGMLGGIVVIVKKFLGSIKSAIKDMGSSDGIIATIKDSFGALTDTLSNMQTTLKASTLLLIAGAVALLSIAVIELSKIDPSKLPAVLGAITVMVVQLSLAMGLIDKLNITTSLPKMVAIGVGMLLMGAAIKVLVDSVKELGKLDWESLAKGLLATIGLMAGLAGSIALLPENPTKMISTGVGMILLAAAIKILASAVGDFAGMDWQKMMQGLIGVGIVLGGLTLFTRLAKVNKGAIGSSAGLILLGVALKILASATSDFADMDPSKIQQGLGALMGVLAMLAIFTRIVNPAQIISVGTAMVILGAALKIIASAVGDMGKMSWEEIGKGLIVLGAALLAITVAMNLMPATLPLTAIGMVLVGAALVILAGALKIMGGMSWEEIAKGLVTLAASLLILAGGLTLMLIALPGAIALMAVAKALAVFVPVLFALGKMDWGTIWTGLGALALSLTLLGIAGILILPAIPGLFALGAAVLLLGAGAALAGVGLMAFAAGMTALAAAGVAGTTALIAIVTGLLGLIPFGMTQLGLGLVALANVIGENIPTFVAAGVKLLLGFLDGLRQVLPAVAAFIFEMILAILNVIATNIPLIVDAGFRILIGFLSGIANNIGRVVDSAVNIIINFLNALADKMPGIVSAGANLIVKFLEGIGNNVGKVTQAGADLVIKTVNEVANTIETRSGEMRAAGGRLADAIIDGMTGGLWSKAKNVAQEAWNLGKRAIEGIQSALDSHSPSKETHKLGTYAGWGLSNGIAAMGGKVENSADKLGRTAVDAIKARVADIWTQLSDEDLNWNPTITPVLDLTTVRRDAQTMGAALAANMAIDSTYNKATMLSAADRANRDAAAAQAEAATKTGGDTNVTYNQTINSPKAISNAEIYRNTNNQLSKIKKGEPAK